MATYFKILGQTAPASSTLTTLYTVPASSNAVVSTIAICNPNPTTVIPVRVAAVANGSTIAQKNYIVYDMSIPAADTVSLSMGITLAQGDFIQVSANGATNISFSAFGSEIS
jgi:hypothetical protein